MSNFPVTSAQISGLFAESVLYGIYLITCGYCMQSLLITDGKWRRTRDYNWFMVIVALLLFILATLDVCFGLYHNLQAFVLYTGPGGAIAEFSNISQWVSVMKTNILLVQTNLGDIVLIYRCWVVYNKSWVIVALSTVLWVGTLVCTVMILDMTITIHTSILILNAGVIPRYLTAFWTTTIALNFLTTGLLVGRIWKVDRQTRRILNNDHFSRDQQPQTLRYVVRIILESGMLYTLTASLSFITFLAGNNAVYPITDMESQIIGIAFNLIIVRAARRRSEETRLSYRPPLSIPLCFQPSRTTSDAQKNNDQDIQASGIEHAIECDVVSMMQESSRPPSVINRRASVIVK